MSRFTGRQNPGASRLERIRRTARALERQLATLDRTHSDTTNPEQDCE